MEIIRDEPATIILKWKKGEEVISSFLKFLEERNIRAGHFTGLGAAESLELGYYNLATREYERKVANYDVEILSLTGNVAVMNGATIIHMHGVFGKRDFSAFGGHVFKLVVAGTCEIHLTPLSGFMKREYDEETGLNLLS